MIFSCFSALLQVMKFVCTSLKSEQKVIFDLVNILLAQDTTGIDKNSEELLV